MAFQYTNVVSTTLSSSPSAGGTSFTITSASGLPTIASGGFGTARIEAEAGNTAEDIIYTNSGTTVTLANSTTLSSAHNSGAVIDFGILSAAAMDQVKQDALSGGPHGANITAAGALTLGVMNYVNLTSASATLTLANGTLDGQMVGIQMLDTCTKLATIDPAGSTKIDGSLTRIMWANESAWLQWDSVSTMWRKVAGRSIPMIGSMYLTSTTANSVNGADTQILFDATDVDNTGLMVNVGANKITLQRPGNYIGSVGVVMGFHTLIGIAQGDLFQGSTRIINAVGSAGTGSAANCSGSLPFIGAASDDMTGKYNQNSGDTTPVIVGGRGSTFISCTEITSW